MVAPSGVDRGQDAEPGPQRLDDRIERPRRRAVAVDLRPQVASERPGVVGRRVARHRYGAASGCHRSVMPILPGRRVYHRPVSSGARRADAATRHRSAPRACRADPERPGRSSPRRLGAVRLRQHDLLVRGRVRRDRAVPRRRPSSASATGTPPVDRDRRQRRASTPSSRRSSARSRTAAPAGCRSCCSSRPCASARRSSSRTSPPLARARPVHRRELRLPGRAHLLRRDAQDRQLPGDARQAVRASGPGSATAARSSSGC